MHASLCLAGGLLFQLAALEADGLIDVHGAFVNAGFGANITCDGCHPVDAGYGLFTSQPHFGLLHKLTRPCPSPHYRVYCQHTCA